MYTYIQLCVLRFFHNRNYDMQIDNKTVLIVLIAIAAVIIGIMGYSACMNHPKQNNGGATEQTVVIDTNLEEIPAAPKKKEGFISSGVDGAFYNEMTNAVQGDSLYSNQMIENGKEWKDVIGTAKEKHIASDGPGTLGAGKGNGFDDAFKAQTKLAEAWDSVRNGYMTNEEFNKLSQEINVSTSPQSDTSMLNRGNQTCGKMNILPNKLVCVIDEKYMDERSKNRDIYKTNTIVHCQGYDIDTNNVGRSLSGSHFSKYLLNNNGTRKITSSGASTKGLKVIEKEDSQKNKGAESFKAKFSKEGFTRTQTNGYNTVRNSEGGVWYHRK